MLRVALVLILCLLTAGCQRQAPHEAAPPLPLRLAYATLQDGALVQIALDRGYFREEGLAVKAQPHGYGKSALQAVLDGKADIATVAETPVMFAALRGERISIVGSIFTSNKTHAVVAGSRAGITRPADLKGKRVGYTPGTTSHIFLSSFLTANRLTAKDLVLVPLGPERMQREFASGRIDAAATWCPLQYLLADRSGANGVALRDPYIYTENFVVAGLTRYVDGNQEAMRRFLRALVRAQKFACANGAQAQALVSAAVHLPPGAVARCWGDSTHAVGLDHALVIALEEETRWAASHDLVPGARMPNYLDYIDPRPLLAVKPEAVDQQVLKK